jgi:excisionase family DNA binding protein
MTSLTLPLPSEFVDALAQRVAEIISEREQAQRWAVGIEGLAAYLGCSLRLARELRAKGLPAKKVGRRVYFDTREVDEWLTREGIV